MPCKPVLAALLCALLLAACVSTGSDDGLERMQRNHNAALLTTA